MAFHCPQHYKIPHPTLGMGEGNNGFFRFERGGVIFNCIGSDGLGWEHVSVSLNKPRCPTWEEMCLVKSIFWDEDDLVVQYHPPKSEYINNHKYCLHLWRPNFGEILYPHKSLVGV